MTGTTFVSDLGLHLPAFMTSRIIFFKNECKMAFWSRKTRILTSLKTSRRDVFLRDLGALNKKYERVTRVALLVRKTAAQKGTKTLLLDPKLRLHDLNQDVMFPIQAPDQKIGETDQDVSSGSKVTRQRV